MTPRRFIAAARALVGAPWRHQGRSPAGIDCVGLLVCAARAASIAVEDVPAYERRPDGRALGRTLKKHCRFVPLDRRRPGDIALMGRPLPTHVGILSEGDSIIHVATESKCCEIRFDPALFETVGIFRPKVFE